MAHLDHGGTREFQQVSTNRLESWTGLKCSPGSWKGPSGTWCTYLVLGVPTWYLVYLSGTWCTHLVLGVPTWYLVYLSGTWCTHLVLGVPTWYLVHPSGWYLVYPPVCMYVCNQNLFRQRPLKSLLGGPSGPSTWYLEEPTWYFGCLPAWCVHRTWRVYLVSEVLTWYVHEVSSVQLVVPAAHLVYLGCPPPPLGCMPTWYLLVELNGISISFLFAARYADTFPTLSSQHFNRADSDASPLHSLKTMKGSELQ